MTLNAILRGRLVAWLALAALAGPAARASEPLPEWARRAIDADTPRWHPGSPGVMLLDSTQVRFLPVGNESGCAPAFAASGGRMSIVTRGAVLLNGDSERNFAYAVTEYDPNTARVVSAKAWIVAPEGSGSRSFGKGEFVDSVAVYSSFVWDSRRILAFPSAGKVGAGEILVWEFRVEDTSPFAEWGKAFLQRFPALRVEFEAIPEPGTRLEYTAGSARLTDARQGAEAGSLRWELLKAEPLSENPPTAFIPNPLAVSVRCSPAAAGAHGWTWDGVSRSVAEITEPRIDPEGDVRARAAGLVAGKEGRWKRIRALADYVQGSIVYLEMAEDRDELAGIRPHWPSDVLRNRYGDCKDKATLLISLLRAIGVDSRMVLVASGNPLAISRDWPSALFNHAVVLISADGTEPPAWPAAGAGGPSGILFDPTNPFTPLGVLPPEDQGGFGLVVAREGGKLVAMPVSKAEGSRRTRKVDVEIDGSGRLQARVSDACSGLSASVSYAERFARSPGKYQEFVEQWVHRGNPLCEDVHWTDAWDPDLAQYHLDVGFSVPSFGRRTRDGLMLVSPGLLAGAARLEPWTVENEGVCALGPDCLEESVHIAIPKGYVLEEVPSNWAKDDPLMSAEIAYQADGDSVIVTKRVLRPGGFYGKADYEAVRLRYRDIQDAERRSVVLREAPLKG